MELSRICGKKTLLHKNHIFEGVGEWGRALGCGREPRLRT